VTSREAFSARETSVEDEGACRNQGAALAFSRVPTATLKNSVSILRKTFVTAWSTLPITASLTLAQQRSGDTSFGRNIYPKALTSAPEIRANRQRAVLTIYNGIRLSGILRSVKDQSDAESTWQRVRFIRHLSALTEEEEKQMEKLNPKSPMEESEEKQESSFEGGKPPMSIKISIH